MGSERRYGGGRVRAAQGRKTEREAVASRKPEWKLLIEEIRRKQRKARGADDRPAAEGD